MILFTWKLDWWKHTGWPAKHGRVFLVSCDASVCYWKVAYTGRVMFIKYQKNMAMFNWSPCNKNFLEFTFLSDKNSSASVKTSDLKSKIRFSVPILCEYLSLMKTGSSGWRTVSTKKRIKSSWLNANFSSWWRFLRKMPRRFVYKDSDVLFPSESSRSMISKMYSPEASWTKNM